MGKVPIPSRGEMRREEDEEKGPRLHGCADRCTSAPTPPPHAVDLGPAAALSCRECGDRVPARPGLRLRRSVSGRSKSPTTSRAATPDELRKRIEAGPGQHLALRAAAARPRRRGRQAEPQPRLHQARQGRQPRPRAGRHRRPVRQGRLRQPDALLQGPRRRHRRRGRPRLRLHHALLLLHRQPRRRRRRRRRPRRLPLLRVHPARPGAGQGRHGRGLRRRTGRHRGQLRRREPLLLRADRRPDRRGLGLRQRQPAPVLRRGLQDPRVRDLRAARLAAARTSSSSRSPPAPSSRRSTRGCRS